MKANWAMLCAAVAAAVAIAIPTDAQAQRFGYIDSQRILAEAPGTNEAQSAFESDLANYRAELEQLEAELEQMQADFDRQQATMTAAVREQRQQEMQQKFIQYQQRQMELEESARRLQAELVGPIMERIVQVIELIRQEGGYALIFDAGSGALISADPSLDLTDQVLARLQQGNP